MLQAWQEMAATTAAASALHMPAWPSQTLRQNGHFTGTIHGQKVKTCQHMLLLVLKNALLGFDHGRKQTDDA